jgi:hypothetical protein
MINLSEPATLTTRFEDKKEILDIKPPDWHEAASAALDHRSSIETDKSGPRWRQINFLDSR